MIFKILMFLLTSIMMVFSNEPGDPVELIKTKDTELQSLLRKSGVSAERTQRMKELINGIFDFQELGKKALGQSMADSMSEDQQKRFVTAFKTMVENTSLKKLDVYKSDSTKYEEPVYTGTDKVKITAHTFYGGQESILDYKMFMKDGQWRSWDLVIDDLSTYRNYKEQFRRILETKDIEELIKILEDKAAGKETAEDAAK